MRRKDLSGAQVTTGAVADTSSRIVCRLSGRKTSGSFKFVISSVFVGGVGCVRGGRFDRSREREDLDEPRREYRGREGDSGEAGDAGDCGDVVPGILTDVNW